MLNGANDHYRMVADLLAGVYYQKCYDPECRRINYCSQSNSPYVYVHVVVLECFSYTRGHPVVLVQWVIISQPMLMHVCDRACNTQTCEHKKSPIFCLGAIIT